MKKSPLLPIFLIVFIDLLGFGLILPLLPFYAESFGASGFVVGLLIASYSFMQFIGAPILGRLSDKWGRRPVLLLSQFGTFIGFIVLGLANTLLLLFLGRIIDGLSGANLSTAQAYSSDVTEEKDRAKSFGLIGAALIGQELAVLIVRRQIVGVIAAELREGRQRRVRRDLPLFHGQGVAPEGIARVGGHQGPNAVDARAHAQLSSAPAEIQSLIALSWQSGSLAAARGIIPWGTLASVSLM